MASTTRQCCSLQRDDGWRPQCPCTCLAPATEDVRCPMLRHYAQSTCVRLAGWSPMVRSARSDSISEASLSWDRRSRGHGLQTDVQQCIVVVMSRKRIFQCMPLGWPPGLFRMPASQPSRLRSLSARVVALTVIHISRSTLHQSAVLFLCHNWLRPMQERRMHLLLAKVYLMAAMGKPETKVVSARPCLP